MRLKEAELCVARVWSKVGARSERQGAVWAESGSSTKTLKRPLLETTLCFELNKST